MCAPRGSGKTHRMLVSAAPNCVIFAASEPHLVELRRRAFALHRNDLKIMVPREDNMRGLVGTDYLFDHYALAMVFSDYAQEFDALVGKIAGLREENARLKSALDDANGS